MNFDPNFWVRQNFSVTIPDALLDLLAFPIDDVIGAVVVVVLVFVQGWREGELPHPEDVHEGQVERALVHVAGPVQISEVV